MTDKSAAAIRELVERWMGKKHPITMQSYVSDLTALISEGYVSKEEHGKVVQQRDELSEALQNLMDGVKGLPPLTAIVGVLEGQYKQAEAAIKNTER